MEQPPANAVAVAISCSIRLPYDRKAAVREQRYTGISFKDTERAVDPEVGPGRIAVGVKDPRPYARDAAVQGVFRVPADDETAIGQGGDARGQLIAVARAVDLEVGPDRGAVRVKDAGADQRAGSVTGVGRCPSYDVAAAGQDRYRRGGLVVGRDAVDDSFRADYRHAFPRKRVPTSTIWDGALEVTMSAR